MKKEALLSLMWIFLDEPSNCFKQNANFVPLNPILYGRKID